MVSRMAWPHRRIPRPLNINLSRSAPIGEFVDCTHLNRIARPIDLWLHSLGFCLNINIDEK